MIPVQQEPECPEFDAEVRQRGKKFLDRKPSPTSRDFKRHNYWTRAKPCLFNAYRRCAYTSRLLRDAARAAVDHFLPKVDYPKKAYEWANYRLARPRLNESKGSCVGIVDPFDVESGWFVMDCPSCLIQPGDNLDRRVRQQVEFTIDELDLNSDFLTDERSRWMGDLATGDISFAYVNREYPFLASEVHRQRIKSKMTTMFPRRRKADRSASA